MNKDLRTTWNPLKFSSRKDARTKMVFLSLVILVGPLIVLFNPESLSDWEMLGLMSYGGIVVGISWLFNKRFLTDGHPRMKGWWLLVAY